MSLFSLVVTFDRHMFGFSCCDSRHRWLEGVYVSVCTDLDLFVKYQPQRGYHQVRMSILLRQSTLFHLNNRHYSP